MKKCIFYKMLANLGKSLKIWFCCRNAQENNFVHRWNWGDNLPLTRNEGSKALDRENQLEYDPIIVWELQREVAGDAITTQKICRYLRGESGEEWKAVLSILGNSPNWDQVRTNNTATTPPPKPVRSQLCTCWVHVWTLRDKTSGRCLWRKNIYKIAHFSW